ncbi:MAG: hypothetical protein ACYYK0_04020 [Candidatus Eutrophobiaceae bacterium]
MLQIKRSASLAKTLVLSPIVIALCTSALLALGHLGSVQAADAKVKYRTLPHGSTPYNPSIKNDGRFDIYHVYCGKSHMMEVVRYISGDHSGKICQAPVRYGSNSNATCTDHRKGWQPQDAC